MSALAFMASTSSASALSLPKPLFCTSIRPYTSACRPIRLATTLAFCLSSSAGLLAPRMPMLLPSGVVNTSLVLVLVSPTLLKKLSTLADATLTPAAPTATCRSATVGRAAPVKLSCCVGCTR
ncbi:hypothetical protein D3C72_1012930 [compost metagenome]